MLLICWPFYKRSMQLTSQLFSCIFFCVNLHIRPKVSLIQEIMRLTPASRMFLTTPFMCLREQSLPYLSSHTKKIFESLTQRSKNSSNRTRNEEVIDKTRFSQTECVVADVAVMTT